MKLTFFGGAKTVTGANYLLESGNTRVLIDCGLFQGPSELVALNEEDFAYAPNSISHVFITHSHQDHCGRLPKLVAEGFSGEIISTEPSKEMMLLSLEDSARLGKREANLTGWPVLYTLEDVEKTGKLMRGYKYHTKLKISPSMSVEILDAGHVLGSAMYKFTLTEKGKTRVITFTGDLGNQPAPLIQAPSKIDYTDYLVIESAYGNRNHEAGPEKKEQLRDVILETIKNKSVLLIPSFAIERTQELIYDINNMVEKHRIASLPILIDSPLAIKMTKVYRKFESYFNFEATKIINSGDDIFRFPGLQFTSSHEESEMIANIPGPKVIIAGSGMSTGGRIMGHEQRYLSDPKNFILFVGFQVAGCLGRQIFEGAPIVNIMGKMIRVRASIRGIGGYSAHADQHQLMNFVGKIPSKLKNIWIVQGERDASYALKEQIETHLKIKATVPKFEETVELE
jgi:metallo-beta-lactamase family protein